MTEKTTTITLSNKVLKKLVKGVFYGGCYTSAYRMRDSNSIHNVFDTLINELKEQGWSYGMNGEIMEPKK